MFGLSFRFVSVGYFLCCIVLDNIGFGILDKFFVLYIDYFVLDVVGFVRFGLLKQGFLNLFDSNLIVDVVDSLAVVVGSSKVA